MATSSTTQVPYGVSVYFDTALLMRAVANFEFIAYAGLSKDIPKQNTVTIKWRRHNTLAAVTTPLTEGVTPAGSLVSVTDITKVIQQFGDFLEFTDQVQLTSDDPDLNDWNNVQADQAADTLDQVTAAEIFAGTSVQFVGGGPARANVAAGDVITGSEIRIAVTTLKNNKAKVIKKIINPTDGFNTTPIAAAFIGFINPSGSFNLKNDAAFIPYWKYSNPNDRLKNEIGSVDEVRFIETTQVPVFAGAGAGGIDVHASLIIGMEAYGVARLAGESMKTIIKPLGTTGFDPMDQRATKAWKAWFGAKRLNEAFMVRIEFAIS